MMQLKLTEHFFQKKWRAPVTRIGKNSFPCGWLAVPAISFERSVKLISIASSPNAIVVIRATMLPQSQPSFVVVVVSSILSAAFITFVSLAPMSARSEAPRTSGFGAANAGHLLTNEVDVKSPRVSATSSFIDSSAQDLLQRSLHLFGRTTNFSAAVDVDTVDRLSTQAQTTRAKEAWKFSRVGLTNTFTRTRFAPVSGGEIIESTNYFGGRLLVGPSSVSMPVDASLPGFEMLNHMRRLFAFRPELRVMRAPQSSNFRRVS